MAYITPVWFRVEHPQPSVMDFIARTPSEHYFLVPIGGHQFYGMFLSVDTLEYLTNEFTVHSLEIVTSAEVRKVLTRPESKIWGNQELTDF
jgi:hypothetical protein